ncbi:E3 ubiquitin-protein ligase RNF14-like isoform X2 [Centruroides vittatus]
MDEESQNDELIVLESIFDESVLKIERIGEPSGSIIIHPDISEKYYVKYEVKNNEQTNSSKYVEFEVKYLPPITLYFVLPRTYPSQLNPAFLLSCRWLTLDQISSLCRKLDKLWHEGEKEVVLYKWIQFLKEETLSFLKIRDYLDISHIPDERFDQNRFNRNSSPRKAIQNDDCKFNDSGKNLHYREWNGYHQKAQRNVYLNQNTKYNNSVQDSCYRYKCDDRYSSYKFRNTRKENFPMNVSNGITQTNSSKYQEVKENKYKDNCKNFQSKTVKNQAINHLCTEQKDEETFNPTTSKRTHFNQNPRQEYRNRNVNGETRFHSQNYRRVDIQTDAFGSRQVAPRNNQSHYTETNGSYQRGSTSSNYRGGRKFQNNRTKWDIKLNSQILTPRIHGGKYDFDLRAVSEMENKTTLITYLTEYNKKKEEEMYSNEWFMCGVCLLEKQGKDFMNFFGCNHKYCKLCMKSYFEIQIQDGNVKSLSCPKEKCISQATQHQIRELVSPDTFARYDRLLLNSILECMTDIVYCPRIFCQTPVILEPDCSMGICPSCEFVFCTYCRMVYHGIASCRFKSEEIKKIREEYLQGDKEIKSQMECRFGKRTLQVLVEEGLSEEWVENNSKKCPNCNASIEKIDGCNKMACWKCKTFFCWICMQILKQVNPYEHFNRPNTPCFNQLFQGAEEFEDSDDEDWAIGAFLI